MRPDFKLLLSALVLICTISGAAMAQETTGTIAGVITDEQGAVLPGVTVVATHVATGRTFQFMSTSTGAYRATLLPSGTYSLTFTLSGFQTAHHDRHRPERERPHRGQRQAQAGRADGDGAGHGRALDGPGHVRSPTDGELETGAGVAAEQPQLRATGHAGARGFERPVRRSRRRAHQHREHLSERRAPQCAQLARGRGVERRRRLEHHAAVDADAGVD